jgi:hypothetical protein
LSDDSGLRQPQVGQMLPMGWMEDWFDLKPEIGWGGEMW